MRLLLRWNAPLGTRSMYGGNVLDTAVWSAINEPRPGQREVIEELLAAGARLEDEDYPTGTKRLMRFCAGGRRSNKAMDQTPRRVARAPLRALVIAERYAGTTTINQD